MERRIEGLFNKYQGICPNHFGHLVSDTCTFDAQIETDEAAIYGTLEFSEDIDVSPEEVVLLAVAYKSKSPGVGAFPKDSWVGKRLHCGSIVQMNAQLAQ